MGLWSTRTFTNSYRVNSYFFIGQLVLFLQLVPWSTRTFSLVNSYFFGQLVLFFKKLNKVEENRCFKFLFKIL